MTTLAGAKTGRNDLCPCGSGRKFKRCCGAADAAGEDTASRFFGVAAVLAGLGLLGGVVAVLASLVSGSGGEAKKVWSAEHGHYHTVGGDEVSGGGPGKVWSEEHGHWHDAAGGSQVKLEADTPVEGALRGLRESQLDDAVRASSGTPQGDR